MRRARHALLLPRTVRGFPVFLLSAPYMWGLVYSWHKVCVGFALSQQSVFLLSLAKTFPMHMGSYSDTRLVLIFSLLPF